MRARRRSICGILGALVLVAACGTSNHGTRALINPGAGAAGGAADGLGQTGSSASHGPGGNHSGTAGAHSSNGPLGQNSDGSSSGQPGQDGSTGSGVSSDGGLPDGSHVIGVTDTTIKIAYVWDAAVASDQSRQVQQQLSPGSNPDEPTAFQAWIKFWNAHPNGDRSIMGFPVNLHGRKLVGSVVDAADYTAPEKNRAAGEQLAKDIKPFAVVYSQTGGTSPRICPITAAAGILNFAVNDYQFGLSHDSNQYCFPVHQSFDKQYAAVARYLVHRLDQTSYVDVAGQKQPRKIGFAYSSIVEAEARTGPVVAKKLKALGVPIVATAEAGGDAGTQSQQAPNIIAQFRAAGVNTVIIQDVVLPIAFTSAAESQGWHPDYVTWPCSFQDMASVARLLYNPDQWQHASGLSCYDPENTPDATVTAKQKAQQWYAEYRTVDSQSSPPTAAPLIWDNMAPLLICITNAGRNLTADSCRQGLQDVTPYRYSWKNGRTTDPTREQIKLNEPNDYSMWGDWTIVQWSNTSNQNGASAPGEYVYPENAKRYTLEQL